MVDMVKFRRAILIAGASLLVLATVAFTYSYYFLYAPYVVEFHISAEEVPKTVLSAFTEKYPSVKEVEWAVEGNTYEVQFIMNGRWVECYFLADGLWAKTEYRATLNEFPSKARAYLKKQRGYKISEIEKVEIPGSSAAYEAELENVLWEWNIQFDVDGNFLSKKRDG